MAFIEYSTSLDGIPEFEMGPDNTEIESAEPWELALIAQEVAEHYWHNWDGWDHQWPKKFEVFADKKSLGVFEVDMEMSPDFTARRSDSCAN